MRLVASAFYADIALAVYVKVKALGLREEGCQARAATIASYLGVSKASVERGLAQLARPAPDQVVELTSRRRTLRGGRGTSALRRTRPLSRTEAFVWVPVAAAEDLSPRQLRAYAVIAYAQAVGLALTEAELAGSLFHHSGAKAGQPLTTTAAGVVVDELESARWLTVRRRAAAHGRHQFVAHDIVPDDSHPVGCEGDDGGRRAEDYRTDGSGTSPVGEGSGPLDDEGSLANEESPTTDRPDDASALDSPAVGEAQVVKGAWPVENPSDVPVRNQPAAPLALRAGANNRPSIPNQRGEQAPTPTGTYTGPQLTMSAEIYAVLEPVHWLLERVGDAFVARKIARVVGRQLRGGMAAERIRHRLTTRLAQTMTSEIRDPGRWLLGVALPRWGCGHQDCETGVMWSTGRRCDVCAQVVADRFLARQRAQRLEDGLCPGHGTRSGPSGACVERAADEAVRRPAAKPAGPGVPPGPPRGTCTGCGARLFLVGRALADRLCPVCRSEGSGPTPASSAPSPARPRTSEPEMCIGTDEAPCGREALPTRSVCARHRILEVASEAA
ncbi:hypothetical protein MHW47_06230 [Streptomyces sp. OfavH-34-F]|uniref:hypothetical protein n=1 Tax=Streptomyces sp. OfavH-34-F TaxID=2917760 RepID=UPI001EF1C512|nr:hypothetical protein [Streptomyces sp. OfavH-34-F]MCG7524039.1 hypothetical protein [Streptomyces sp. OfavH-34-F]